MFDESKLRERLYEVSGLNQYQVSLHADADLEDRTGALMAKMIAAIHGGIRRVLVANGVKADEIGKVIRYLETKEGRFLEDLTDILLKMRIPHSIGRSKA